MAKKQKHVNFEIHRGVRLSGKAFHPKYNKAGKLEDDSPIVKIPESLARDLVAASKGVVTNKDANTSIMQEQSEEDLDKAFFEGAGASEGAGTSES